MFICEALYILYLIHFYTNMYVIVERNLYWYFTWQILIVS